MTHAIIAPCLANSPDASKDGANMDIAVAMSPASHAANTALASASEVRTGRAITITMEGGAGQIASFDEMKRGMVNG